MRRSRLIVSAALALLVGVGVAGIGLRSLAADDKIILETGGRYEGTIVDEKPSYVKIKTRAGVYTVYRDEIVKIIRGGDVFTEYEKRSDKLRDRDVDGWLALAEWCVEQELYPQSIDCYHRVLAVEPDHDGARAALGYRYDKGDWVTEDEFYERRGWVIHEGEWVSPEDKQKLDQGLV